MAEIHIDAKGAILGRIGTSAAKLALQGHTVKIFNCEDAIISGNPRHVREHYWRKRVDLGQPQRGPYYSRMPDRFFRRLIRGMFPMNGTRGREAYARVMCYRGIPTEFKDAKPKHFEEASASKLRTMKWVRVGDLCKSLGGKA